MPPTKGTATWSPRVVGTVAGRRGGKDDSATGNTGLASVEAGQPEERKTESDRDEIQGIEGHEATKGGTIEREPIGPRSTVRVAPLGGD